MFPKKQSPINCSNKTMCWNGFGTQT